MVLKVVVVVVVVPIVVVVVVVVVLVVVVVVVVEEEEQTYIVRRKQNVESRCVFFNRFDLASGSKRGTAGKYNLFIYLSLAGNFKDTQN